MREVVGDRTVDEVLTVGRQQIETAALEKMQTLANRYKLGLRIDQVQLKNVNPPPKVQQSFNEVNKAQQEKEQSINEAWKENNKEVPRAKGLADQEISQAEGYAAERVNEAEGDAGKFIAVFEAFQKAPEVTKRRMYLETLAEVVPKLGSKIIMDEDAKQVLPLLQLSNQKN
jgi:membrane protease subunit HflK